MHGSYELIKSLKEDTMSKDELIKITREYTANIISAAEQYIKIFREYLNNTITEEQLIDSVAPLNIEISKWFLNKVSCQYPQKSYTIGRIYIQKFPAQYMISLFL